MRLLRIARLLLVFSIVLPAARTFADDSLKKSLEEFVAGIRTAIEETDPVFLDDVFRQWAKLTLGLEHMTYIVDTRDPQKTLGVVTFMCKVTQSDFFDTREEAEAAPIKNMVPQLIPCRATYERRDRAWAYVDGATYVRRGDWEPVPTDKPNAFPQIYFELMKPAPTDPAEKALRPSDREAERDTPPARSGAVPQHSGERAGRGPA